MKNFLRASEVKVFAKKNTFYLWSCVNFQDILSFLYVFLAKTWTSEARRKLSMRRKNTLGYIKHFPKSGKCSAFWIMTVRPTKHFLLKEKWLSSRFLKIKLLKLYQTSEYSAVLCFFWQRLWLQKSVENFPRVVRIRSRYVKHSSRSGKCSALWIMTVRPTNHFLLQEKWLSSRFLKIQFLKLCRALHSVWVFGEDFDFRSL